MIHDEVIIQRLRQAYEDSLSVYKADREAGADAVSVAWNAGRVDGLKQALDMVSRMK